MASRSIDSPVSVPDLESASPSAQEAYDATEQLSVYQALNEKMMLFRDVYLSILKPHPLARKTVEQRAQEEAERSVHRIEQWIDKSIEGAKRRPDGIAHIAVPRNYVHTLGTSNYAVEITSEGRVTFGDPKLQMFNRTA